jgi:hypothetical protein
MTKEEGVKAPKNHDELERLLESINSSEDGAEALSMKLDLMLRLLLEIRDGVRLP